MKKIILISLAFMLASSGWFYFIRQKQKPVFPDANILLITIDTIRPDYLSCYGSSNRTPNIDEIANNGILFENAFCQVPLTFPSHTSILTGLFPVHHGMHQNGLDIFHQPDQMITAALHSRGYKTAAVVSSFVLDRKFGLAKGFDVYDDRMERGPLVATNFEVERPANETIAASLKLLEQWQNDKWFLWIHLYDPHTPYLHGGYGEEIAFVDEQIGKLMQWLHNRNLDQQLIVAILGDHGESLGEHGEKTHGFFVYNSTLKIPMIFTYPEAKQKRLVAPVAAVDVAPTILQLAGVADSTKRDGVSLFETPYTRDIYFESNYAQLLGWNGLQGLIRGNWKLISTTKSELYDLTADPQEKKNLFSAREEISRPLKNDILRLAHAESSKPAVADLETLEKLKSLGYIGSTNLAKTDRTADPKDKISLWSKYEESLEAKQNRQEVKITQLLQSLVEQEPTNNFFRLSLATHYREKKDTRAAIEHLQQAIRNDPADANGYHELAITYKQTRNYSEALRAEEAAIALQPNRSEFRGVRGMIWVETGRFAKAKAEFLQVLGMDPNNPVAWNNLGNSCREMNQLDEAEQAYRRAIELSPNYAYPLNGLGTVLVRRNKIREAIPHFEKALQLDPKFVEVYLNMAIAFHTLNESQRARTLYLAFLKVAPDWMEKEKQNAQLLLSQLP